MAKSYWAKNIPLIIGGIVVVLVAAGIYLLISSLDSAPKKKKVVQQITIITPPKPPPEPPPPPPDEPEPEPEVEEEVIEEQIEEAMPDEAGEDLADDLGLDADGTGAGDSFGLRGRKGGRGMFGRGGGYPSKIKQTINELIAEDSVLKRLSYVINLKIWFSPEGGIQKFDVLQRSGDESEVKIIKERIALLLAQAADMNGPAPLEMPQPLKFKVSSRL